MALLAGCGRIGFDVLPAPDIPPDAVSTVCLDAWQAGTIAFDPPTLIPELATTARRGNPSLSPSGLHLYFADDSSGNLDIWRADRDAVGQPWRDAAPVSELNSTSEEGKASVGGDGTFVVFQSKRGGANDVWYATRPQPFGAFSAPTKMYVGTVNGTGTQRYDPEVRFAGKRLYFAPQLASAQVIEVAQRSDMSSAFGAPKRLTELEISAAIADPTLSDEEQLIVFSSGAGAETNDLYYAMRSGASQPFGAPVIVPTVNAVGADDLDAELSADGCELYFKSDRDGHDQLYVAHAH